MVNKNQTMKFRSSLGAIAIVLGFIAVNLALFHWYVEENIIYLMGQYARYACAYGGVAAISLGSILINDFLCYRTQSKHKKDKTKSIFNV